MPGVAGNRTSDPLITSPTPNQLSYFVPYFVRWCRCDGTKEKMFITVFSKTKDFFYCFPKTAEKINVFSLPFFPKQQIFFCRSHLHHRTNVLHTRYLLSLCDASFRLNHFHVVSVYYHFHCPPVWKFIFCIVYFMIFLFMANKDTYMHIPRRTGADIR